MLVPVGVTLADYIIAVKNDEPTHVRITFIGQNVVLTDDDIESSGIRINDYLNGDTDLVLGKAVMKNISIPIIRSSKVASLIWTGEFKVEIGQEINGITNWVTIGYFIGSRPDKVNSVDIIEFNANDKMIFFEKLAKGWIDSLTYPKTIKELFQSLCVYCGVWYEDGDELSYAASKSYISFPYQTEGQTCRDILSQIAEVCGCYAKINSNGNCQMVWFANHTSDYTVDEQDEFDPVETYDYSVAKTWAELESFTWEDLKQFMWADLGGTKSLFTISAVNAVDTLRGDNIQYPEYAQGNVYTIVDNPFITSSNDVLTLYNRLHSYFTEYIPMNINCIGNALIEAGDIINVVVNGTTFALPIFCKSTTWNGALTDNYEVTGQPTRTGTSIDSVKHISENTKYYNRQSGIEILPEGIDIIGSKYVRIYSGGSFDVDSENFKVDSVNKIVKTGDYTLDELGLYAERILIVNQQPYPVNTYFGIHTNRIYDSTYPCISVFPTYNYEKTYGGMLNISIQDGYGCEEKRICFQSNGTDNIHIFAARVYQNPDLSHTVTTCKGTLGASDALWDLYAGTIYYNNLVQNSSKDIKHDIRPMEEEGERLDKLKPVTFIYDNDENERRRNGLIYEDTIDVMPNICTQDEKNKAINYVELIPVLLKEIQDLRKRVADLEAKVEGRE